MTNQPPTRDQLKAECYTLIDEIANHCYGIKLLLAAKRGLQLYCDYKANRQRFRW